MKDVREFLITINQLRLLIFVRVSSNLPCVSAEAPGRADNALSPLDASVTIDEQYVGPLAYVAAHGVILPVGEHRVTVEKSGCFPYDALVTADRAPVELKVVLEGIPD